ncbi:MAG: 1-phosphofructokinase [Lachnospiraceae bacterium]|nr:1-phosphofructokinase [Lachnospiraceae bacterium]
MILTVTLNPAIDKTYRTGQLITGHVNRMSEMENIPGGKGINVSKILCCYGCSVTATGFLGGYTGRWIEERIQQLGMECAFVNTAGDTRCSMNIIADNGYVTEILEPGPMISDEEQRCFLKRYAELVKKCELVVLSGSIAPGLPVNTYTELIDIASKWGRKVILDASGEALKFGVEAKPWLVKPNRQELEYLVGHRCSGQDEILEAADILLEKGITYVAVTVGDKGMYLLSRNRRLFARAPKVKVLNTVGCGDSACASFAMSALREKSMEWMIRHAVAVSSAHATTMENGCLPLDLVEELFEQVWVENI